MSEHVRRTIRRFQQVALDIIPIFFLIPLLIMTISYNVLPKQPPQKSTLLIIVNTIVLALAILDIIVFPRYDRWILLPILMSSENFREMFIYWLVEPMLSIGVALLGLVIALLAKSWSPMIVYIIVSYICLAILAFKFKRHLEVLEERLEKLEKRGF